jgi:uncharacterized protein YgbK (DUF1537 family)
MIYIIADDLTGATDTGAQFSKQGYNTQVVIVSEADSRSSPHSGHLTEDIDVLVIDTETREVDAASARNRIRSVLRDIHFRDEDIVYKKVDSTLRGSIGVELDECLKALKKDVCIFTPSFPQNKRITVEGYLIVQDQPLGLSEYYTGNLDPGEASYIPSLLKQQTDFPIACIDLKEVIQGKGAILEKIRELYQRGKRILVVDSINREQLQGILKSSFEFDGSVLYSGSAGLANALSGLYEGKRHTKINTAQGRKPVLIVSGSMRTIAQRQLEYLKRKVELFEVSLDVEQLLKQRSPYLAQCTADAIQALRAGHHVVIHPDVVYLDKHVNDTVLLTHQLDFRSLGLAIQRFLGALTANIIEDTLINNLILTGGDTAIGVCSALGIYHLNIVDELLPGIPLSIGQFKGNINLKIVTKAGGFGEEETLDVLFEKLVQQQH